MHSFAVHLIAPLAAMHVCNGNCLLSLQVPMEEHVQVHVLARSAAVRVRDWTMASALQIAVWKVRTQPLMAASPAAQLLAGQPEPCHLVHAGGMLC